MIEKARSQRKSRLAVAALAATVATSEPLQSSEAYTPSDPSVIAKMMLPQTRDVANAHEAVAVSIPLSGEYRSIMRRPGLGIIPDTAFREMLQTLERGAGRRLNGLTMWLTHDHPVGAIKKFHLSNGIPEREFRRPEALLNGPAIIDCERFFSSSLMTSFNDMPVINLIVEPGGNWVCSSIQKLATLPADVEQRYLRERQKLLIASQRKNNPMPDVRQFEKNVLDLTGMRIRFVPHGAPLSEFEKARDEVLK